MRLEEALILTAEVLGTPLSPAAAKLMLADLAPYPEPAVLEALARCRREVTGRLTLAAIIERLDDGRPGPEAAWAGCPRDEGETVVWTEEQREAFGVAAALLAEGDRVGARMAFLEAYRRLVAEARAARRPVTWAVSLGHDVAGREGPIREALAAGRLAARDAAGYLPEGVVSERPALPAGPESMRTLLARSLPAEARAALEAELAHADAEAAAIRQARDAREAARRRLLAQQAATLRGQTDAP